MKNVYRKRMYNFSLFFGDIYYLLSNSHSIVSMLYFKRLERSLIEKIMLATTAVNECAHCTRLHTTLALLNGVDQSEIDEILAMDIGTSVSPAEVTAIAFAQHYAEHNRSPKPEAVAELVGKYGEDKAKDIVHCIRFIYIGNLIGNTVDGFVSRIGGVKPENGHIVFEIFTLLLCATLFLPVVLPAFIWIRIQKYRFNRKKETLA